MMTFKLPYELNTDQLIEQLESVDFWEPIEDSFIVACSEELRSRESLSCTGSVFASKTIDTDFLRESSSIRSWIIESIGFGTFQNVLKRDSSFLTTEKRNQFDHIAEIMNESSFCYSQQFINTFSTSGIFTADDIWAIVDSCKSISETEKMISMAIENESKSFDDIDSILSEIENRSFENEIEKDDFDWITGTYTTEKQTETIESESIYFQTFDFSIQKLDQSMKNSYVVDDKELVFMRQMIKNSPKQFSYAARNTLNEIAIDIRKESIISINREMVIRNKSLPRKSMWAEKAKLSSDVSSMFSEIGSINAGITRFTGWGEQEGVRTHKRKRFATTLARGKRSKRSLPAKDRMNTGSVSKLENLTKYKGVNNRADRALAMSARIMHGGKTSISEHFMSNNRLMVTGDHNELKHDFAHGIWGMRPVNRRPWDNIRNKELKNKIAAQKAAGIPKKKRDVYRPITRHLKGLSFSGINISDKKKSLQPKKHPWLKPTVYKYMGSEKPKRAFRNNLNKQVQFLQRMNKK